MTSAQKDSSRRGIACGLLAAVLFGASTPFAKLYAAQVAPLVLAGLLYLGSGTGLLVLYLARRLLRPAQQADDAALSGKDVPWLAGAIAAGGIVAPVLLMAGLTSVSGAAASLLLNIEGVLTALLAWFVFKENFDRRIFLGMVLIVLAGVLLAGPQAGQQHLPWGALSIIGACLCWAIDNNLTRKVSGSDAVQIACIKGVAAGTVNLLLAASLKLALPPAQVIASVGLIGFCGYGVSLVMFVLALRHLGTARTGAYFSTAPFAGAAIAMALLHEHPAPVFWVAAALMAAGIWLHLTESHAHEHAHAHLDHSHAHTHDSHHQHVHDFDWDGAEPHVHRHQHLPMTHAHAHYPDIHHQHRH